MEIELVWATASELADAIREKKCSSLEVVNAFLGRIYEIDPVLNSYLSVFCEHAMNAARNADRKTADGGETGILHGVPIAIKDLIEYQGRVTSGGSKAWEKRKSLATAALVRQLEWNGAIIIGKTNLVEFALGSWGTNYHLGTARNPWNISKVPGGSSSGSAVAVAAGLCAAAIGTDTGGSIRIPAAWCGVVGLKPTAGSVDMSGVLPLSPSLDSAGPITRSVTDAALVFEAMRLDSRRGLAGEKSPFRSGSVRGSRLGGLKIAAVDVECLGFVAEDILGAYLNSLGLLRDLGATIVRINVAPFIKKSVGLNGKITVAEAYGILGGIAEDATAMLDPHVRERILGGKGIGRGELDSLLRDRKREIRDFREVMGDCGAMVLPTMAFSPPDISEVNERETATQLTRMGNYLGLCGLAVPNGLDRHGMPSSLQILGLPGNEEAILRIGMAYEKEAGCSRRPSLSGVSAASPHH
ncbi:MAG: amidase [Burkholderiales bacterium]|nr:amidase [Burkholderiales bacterium]